MIRLDGRCGEDRGAICYLCKQADPVFRCKDCFGGEMYCQQCMVDLHASENLSVSGIGTIDCIRHNLKRPCSVGDLQKGEK